MKWTSSLRRWTMRSIHAAILGSALLGSASLAVAQAPSTASVKTSNAHYTKSQTFDLPVEMDPAYRATLTEIRLYVKTPTSAWALQDKGTAELKRFNIRVAQDGEYWYSLVTVDRQGRTNPSDVNMEGPSQRVIVDTTPPLIRVQSGTTPEGELCLRCTVEDANPDYTTLRAVCKTGKADIPLESVPNQPGAFRVKSGELMQYPVMISAMDMAKNESTKIVNVRDMIGTTLSPAAKSPPEALQPVGRTEQPKEVTPLPPPRFSDLPPVVTPPSEKSAGTKVEQTVSRLDFPPLQPDRPPLPGVQEVKTVQEAPTKAPQPAAVPNPSGVPHQLINTTHATVDYRIDQVGPSGVGKVELYMTPDKGQTWHRLSEDVAKRSPASINLPGDGLYGIRIVVSNGNGFGGRAPVRGDASHCTIEVDTTSPFVQLRSTELQAASGHVELRWNATDKNLGAEPVSLFYRTRPDGPWQVIARGVKNEGVHRWAFPREAGGQFFFKIEVTDLAGNIAQDVSRQPTLIDITEPRATVINVSGSGAVRPGNGGQ